MPDQAGRRRDWPNGPTTRIDLPNIAQHVVQRGNNRLLCFLDDGDTGFCCANRSPATNSLPALLVKLMQRIRGLTGSGSLLLDAVNTTRAIFRAHHQSLPLSDASVQGRDSPHGPSARLDVP